MFYLSVSFFKLITPSDSAMVPGMPYMVFEPAGVYLRWQSHLDDVMYELEYRLVGNLCGIYLTLGVYLNKIPIIREIIPGNIILLSQNLLIPLDIFGTFFRRGKEGLQET